MNPLYCTYESELKFDAGDNTSSDEGNFALSGTHKGSSYEDGMSSEFESDDQNTEEPQPLQFPTITPTPLYNASSNTYTPLTPFTPNGYHPQSSKSVVINRGSSHSISTTQTPKSYKLGNGKSSPIPRKARPRSQTRGTHHLSTESFHHFRIKSITINPNFGVGNSYDHNRSFADIVYHSSDEEYDDDDDYKGMATPNSLNTPIHQHSHNQSSRILSPRAMMNAINEDEEDDVETPTRSTNSPISTPSPQKRPGHKSSGTTLIDGHPPLPDTPPSQRNGNHHNHHYAYSMDTNTRSPSSKNQPLKYKIIPKKTSKNNNNENMNEINVDPKVEFIEKEIVETEETYYRGLNTLLNELIIPLFDNGFINQKYFQQCTSNLPALLEFHDKFLTQLVDAYEYKYGKNGDHKEHGNNVQIKTISQVFTSQNKEEFINLYLTYIRDYDSILDLFGNKFHKNHGLKEFLKQKRKERKPLTNFLILPVQRVPRYILLLTDLKKHTNPTDIDYKNIELALDSVEEITNEINERQRAIENMSQCLQIQESLSDLTESIVKAGRQYQHQFVFVKKSNKHQRQFFCFNDIVIVSNQNWRVKEILDIKTIDVKIKQPGGLKKKKSFRFGIGSKNKDENDTSIKLTRMGSEKDVEKEKNKDKFAQFTLLNTNNKPCSYISKTISDITEFEQLIKTNRLRLIDTELAQSSDTNEIRQALKEQGVSQADDYNKEISSMRSKRRRGNASADKYFLAPSQFSSQIPPQ